MQARRWSAWTLWTPLITMSVLVASSATDLQEYCPWQTFNASCAHNEVILMQTARYGRMRFGKCMKEDHGNVGCKADVLSHLDRKCSGRQSCTFTVPDATLRNIHPCPKELMPYLEARYSCVPVEKRSPHSCAVFGGQVVTGQDGYMLGPRPVGNTTPLSATAQGVGTHACPWLVQVQPGQRINLTLYTFGVAAEAAGSGASASGRHSLDLNGLACRMSLLIQEARERVSVPVCKPATRQRTIYMSATNALRLYVSDPDRQTAVTFIVRYTAVGCADITGINNAYIRRKGDRAEVRCNFTGETYFLSCADSGWKGELGNCSKASPFGAQRKDDKNLSFPYGLLIVIGIGVALGVALGIMMLFGILFCLRRRKEDRLRSQTTDPLLSDGQHESEDTLSATYDKGRRCPHAVGTLTHAPPAMGLQDSHGRVTECLYGHLHQCQAAMPPPPPQYSVDLVPSSEYHERYGTLSRPGAGAAGNSHSGSIDLEKLNNVVNKAASIDRQLMRDLNRAPPGDRMRDTDSEMQQTSFITFKPGVMQGTPDMELAKRVNPVTPLRRSSMDLLKDSRPQGEYRQLNPETLVLECTCTLRQGQNAEGQGQSSSTCTEHGQKDSQL